MARARKVAWLSSAIIDIHNPKLDTSVKRWPHAMPQNGFIPWQKDRPKKKRERGEEEELGRGNKTKKRGPGGENDEQREPGNGPRGPNRKRGKSTGKYVVDSAERRPKAKWNSVR